jgi:hypothetical protein
MGRGWLHSTLRTSRTKIPISLILPNPGGKVVGVAHAAFHTRFDRVLCGPISLTAWIWEDQGDGTWMAAFDLKNFEDENCVPDAIQSASVIQKHPPSSTELRE